jgi:short-subunit dehydrogenase involved in D-alanine esterification of teichoic acids
MKKDEPEIAVGTAQNIKLGARDNFEQVFSRLNR